jgi:predicted peptidase
MEMDPGNKREDPGRNGGHIQQGKKLGYGFVKPKTVKADSFYLLSLFLSTSKKGFVNDKIVSLH